MKAIKLIANEAHVEGYIKVPDEWYSYDNQAITGASACAVMLVAQAKLIEQLEEKIKSAEVLK